jgi:hypothetical protein
MYLLLLFNPNVDLYNCKKPYSMDIVTNKSFVQVSKNSDQVEISETFYLCKLRTLQNELLHFENTA